MDKFEEQLRLRLPKLAAHFEVPVCDGLAFFLCSACPRIARVINAALHVCVISFSCVRYA